MHELLDAYMKGGGSVYCCNAGCILLCFCTEKELYVLYNRPLF